MTEHTVNSHAHESTLLITDQSPIISSTPDTLFSTLHSSQSSSDSSHTDDEDKEFPPKRALRLVSFLKYISVSLGLWIVLPYL